MNTNVSARSYNAIIESTLSQAIQLGLQSRKSREAGRREIAGFSMLQGPTGGGKSSALYRQGKDDGLPPALEQLKTLKHQAIFVTHRWNILHDVYENVIDSKDSSGEPLTASVIYAQDENIISALVRKPLPHELHVTKYDLPDPLETLRVLDSKKLLLHTKWNYSKLHRTARRIIQGAGQLDNRNIHGSTPLGSYFRSMQREIQLSCGHFEFMLLKNMQALEGELKKAKEKFGKDAKLTELANKKLRDFRANEWIRRIFPGIAWRDDKQHLLIMTTQKLFSSFYDGKQKVRMSSNELKGHVIFVDEFDYQSDVLQLQLAQSQLVHEPPECLGQLLDGGRRLLKRMLFDDTGRVPEIRERLTQLLDDLEEELEENHIDLKEDRALVVPAEDYKSGKGFKSQYLFRADHMVTSKLLSMRQASHGFEIRERQYGEKVAERTIDIDKFLRLMEKYIRQFSLMLSDFSSSESEERDLLKELSSLLFDPVNDYRPSHYSSALPSLSLFALPQAGLPELDELRKSNILPNTHANLFGLTNWQLRQNVHGNALDGLRIQIRRAFLPTTPEGLMVSMASRNLVFGLSATSYIERALGHFDVRWINSALRYIAEARNPEVTESYLGSEFNDRPKEWFKRPIPYVQSDMDIERQNKMITYLSNKKAELRQTDLQVTVTDFDEELSEQERDDLLLHLSPEFFQDSDNDISDFTKKFRQETLCNLINVVVLAAKRSIHRGQLAYVNSAKYFRKWLTGKEAENSRGSLNWLCQSQVVSEALGVNTLFNSFNDVFVPIQVNKQEIIICLLNAECQKRTGFSEAYQAAFDTGSPVLIVTQTASATNGINLDFKLADGKAMDLSCIYLLESRHFYFSNYDTSDENLDEMAHAGNQMRNLDKLRRYSEISRSEHRMFISAIMDGQGNQITQLNNRYKKSSDYIKNTAADEQQRIGRLERVWDHIGKVEICLSHKLAHDLVQFTALPAYTNHKQILSDLNQKLLDRLVAMEEESSGDVFSAMFTPTQTGEQAVQIIDETLIPAIRKSRQDPAKVDEIAKLWEQLGRAVLQLDYAWNPNRLVYGINQPLKEWACIEKPTHSSDFSEIWYDPTTWQFFEEFKNGRIMYRPDRLYKYIQSHSAIIDWFNKKGYRTSMYPIANELEETYLLHPQVTQRLLQGRLGEEAVRALLHAKGVFTHTTLNSPRVLERYDFTVSNSDYRVDAKFWGDQSLNKADEQYQEWLQGGAEPDKAPLGLVTTLEDIRLEEGEDVKLAILNFVSTERNAKLIGFNKRLKPVPVQEADIIVLNGCLHRDKNETVTTGFNQFVNLVFEQQYREED
ncbi:hypothetical protein [Vibrio sp. SCSIO 43169]|uniref:hypothetical protein n=1 Tax=Vibrio sp. SCSIO 43169 TaxID=2822801 RepID=UPI0020445B9E|nr:hypothetical protein [Vibrio sp. SCSIO 43169]MCM5506724.1 hypothetical protein [Vibrio sp. SCSIO 43169]